MIRANDSSPKIRCAIYCRKSTEDGLEQEFNSLDAQREAGEAFVASQRNEGWVCLPDQYDDGGFSGGNMDRPGIRQLLKDIEAGRIDCVVVYKVDRLSRSLMDFARIMETFEKHNVSFVSVTQQFNTTHSMGRLTLNILLSFAQFEREIIGERIRDKIAAQRRRGRWAGGIPVLGYDVDRTGPSPKLVINPAEAVRVREIFDLYLNLGSLLPVVEEHRGTHQRDQRVFPSADSTSVLDVDHHEPDSSMAAPGVPVTPPLQLALPYPPSVNHYWRRVGTRTLISRAGRRFRESILQGLAPYNLRPLTGDLSVTAVFHPPDEQPRDVDNLAKALLDALQHAGVYEDDSQIVRLTLDKRPPLPGGRALVTIQPHNNR